MASLAQINKETRSYYEREHLLPEPILKDLRELVIQVA